MANNNKSRAAQKPKVEEPEIKEEVVVVTTEPEKEQMRQTELQLTVTQAEARRRGLLSIYKKEERIPVYLPALYQAYLGRNMQVSINGITIWVPVDSQTYYVPKTFAEEINARRMRVDDIIQKGKKMSDVSNNFESSPGDIQIF